MPVLMIGYDLNRERTNYSAKHRRFTDHIKASFEGWWCHLDSTYLVYSRRDPIDVANELLLLLDANDEILVARIGRDAAWGPGFSEQAKDWLDLHLSF